MERQNVTLSLPRETLRKAKRIAVEKGTSLSGLLSEFIEETVRQDASYERAARSFKARLKTGLDLGTGGKRTWTRESLYER